MITPTKNPTLQPYLLFGGRCDEAIEFYKKAVGAEVLFLARFKESPDRSMLKPGSEEKVMHSSVRFGDTTIYMSDGHCEGHSKFEGFSLSLSVATEAEADRYFNALAEGGQVRVPLNKTFFSPRFGVLADRFGLSWMIMVPA